jgi:hypothetical protein
MIMYDTGIHIFYKNLTGLPSRHLSESNYLIHASCTHIILLSVPHSNCKFCGCKIIFQCIWTIRHAVKEKGHIGSTKIQSYILYTPCVLPVCENFSCKMLRANILNNSGHMFLTSDFHSVGHCSKLH